MTVQGEKTIAKIARVTASRSIARRFQNATCPSEKFRQRPHRHLFTPHQKSVFTL